jgi:hypothetical protein
MALKTPQMFSLGPLTDRYSRVARLYPTFVLMAPAALCVIAAASVKLSWLESLAAGLGACGGTFLLSQLARDPGKSLEKRLYDEWDGMPSIAILRHRDTRIDPVTKARYHKRLLTLVKGSKAFTPETELANPVEADQLYAAWSTFLRNHTRDHSRYPLIFDELVSYGYRRNLLGLRPYGVFISVTCGIVVAGLAAIQ